MNLTVLLNFLILVVIVGGLLYLMNLAPIDATIKKIATVIVLIVGIVWALRWLVGFLH